MRLLLLFLFVQQIFAASENGAQLNEERFASGVNGFSLELTKHLNYTSENELFSPLGIAMTAGMLMKGAQGKVRDDLYKMLGMSEYENKEKIHDMFHNVSQCILVDIKDKCL
ncbi:hypothetical protein B4U80_11755 [Leptotrombidium deliense]|uniref:Serpin domain-containing protein n=1 Tax=Leptotrombidium deliense TaxID=299467 RepID=A0A443S2U9_9ACAR|nr:hypothetical protein B4U80_11755 [Leptotrombidium deliense]